MIFLSSIEYPKRLKFNIEFIIFLSLIIIIFFNKLIVRNIINTGLILTSNIVALLMSFS